MYGRLRQIFIAAWLLTLMSGSHVWPLLAAVTFAVLLGGWCTCALHTRRAHTCQLPRPARRITASQPVRQAQCLHRGAVEDVMSVDVPPRLVAHLCVACGEQLPADWSPSKHWVTRTDITARLTVPAYRPEHVGPQYVGMLSGEPRAVVWIADEAQWLTCQPPAATPATAGAMLAHDGITFLPPAQRWPRLDLVAVPPGGQAISLTGKPDMHPVAPACPPGWQALYTIRINPGTAQLGYSDIQTWFRDGKPLQYPGRLLTGRCDTCSEQRHVGVTCAEAIRAAGYRPVECPALGVPTVWVRGGKLPV